MARIGLVACDILKNEFEFLLKDDPDFVEKKYLEFALHVDPEHMRDVIIDEVNDMLARVDAVLLGYAVCSSLDAIEKRQEVFGVIWDIDGPEGSVLYERYINLRHWEDICVLIHYSWVQTHEYHKRGLRIVQSRIEPNT